MHEELLRKGISSLDDTDTHPTPTKKTQLSYIL